MNGTHAAGAHRYDRHVSEVVNGSEAVDRGSTSIRTVPSEEPLRIFVSSVMRPETESARDACSRVLSTPIYQAWMWEHTPASPDQPREVYLAAVERSEVVIWLVGSETSSPVRDEIELAARLGKRPVRQQRVSLYGRKWLSWWLSRK